MYIKFTRAAHKDYFEMKTNSIEMELLGNFLESDVRCGSISSYKNWILDPQYEDTAGNLTFIEKENGKIIIGDLFADDSYKIVFETTQEQLLKILDLWEALCKRKYKEIIITKEGDKLTLEGMD